jgi:hypothetical protein
MILLALAACVHTVAVTSDPTPAELTLPDGTLVVTPAEIEVPWTPFRPWTVIARAPGRRPLTLDVKRRDDELRLLLVREHGPAGTWTEEEVK